MSVRTAQVVEPELGHLQWSSSVQLWWLRPACLDSCAVQDVTEQTALTWVPGFVQQERVFS